MMTKKELEELMHGVAASMIYGHYLSEFAERTGGEAAMVQQMQTIGYKFPPPPGGTPNGLSAVQLHAMFGVPQNLHTAKGNFFLMLRFSLVRFCFESVLHYVRSKNAGNHAGLTQDMAVVKAEPWFYFTRTVRNVVSHRDHAELGKWDDELTDKGVTTITWRHRTVTTADVGKALELTGYEAWQLYLDMVDFVQKRLP